MNRKKPAADISFLSAIRRGMSSEVVRQMDGWLFGQRTFHDENDDEIFPLLLAVEHQRWAVALDLIEHRNANPNLLPPPHEANKDYPVDEGPGVANTAYKRAVNILLEELRKKRATKPLPKPLMERVDRLMEPLVGEHGKEATLARAIVYGPTWLTWADQLLDRGADPNAYFVGDVSGRTIHLLELAGRFCAKSLFDRLLDAGANPRFKHHNFDLAAHRIADLEHWPVRLESQGLPKLDEVLVRRQCLDRLLAIEGVSQTKGGRLQTPEQIWDQSMEWLTKQGDQALSGAERSQWQAKRMEILAFRNTPVAAARPKTRI